MEAGVREIEDDSVESSAVKMRIGEGRRYKSDLRTSVGDRGHLRRRGWSILRLHRHHSPPNLSVSVSQYPSPLNTTDPCLASSPLHILLLFYDWSRHAHHHHLICASFDESEHRRRRHGLELAVIRVSSSPSSWSELAVIRVSSSPSSWSRACRGCRRLHEMVEVERAQQRRI
ncbi:hypothetical protein Bca4012_093322 [Brassica carinata]